MAKGYVALSRVRSADGLHLVNWNGRALRVHPDVLAKDVKFRRFSDALSASRALRLRPKPITTEEGAKEDDSPQP